MDMDLERAAKIAALNDAFRKSGSGVMVTPGIQEFGVFGMSELLSEVRHFDSFTEDNDPYGEHDFGSLEWGGEKVFWKIDYYDPELKFGRDPLDVECKRVLTVMLASEY
jgi:hypothetical protein